MQSGEGVDSLAITFSWKPLWVLQMKDRSNTSPYGGEGWSPRKKSLKEEIGTVWSSCGVNTEWTRLKRVLLHCPGIELTGISDPDKVQMIEIPFIEVITKQHDHMAAAFRNAGVAVSYVEPSFKPPPNLMFVADLLFTTPEGVILARPASSVRAGEERFIAVSLSRLGIPVLRSIRGNGTFEGADAAWLNSDTVMIYYAHSTCFYTWAALALLSDWILLLSYLIGQLEIKADYRLANFQSNSLVQVRTIFDPFL